MLSNGSNTQEMIGEHRLKHLAVTPHHTTPHHTTPHHTCTRQSMSWVLTSNTRFMRLMSSATPPRRAATWPSTLVPTPNGIMGTRSALHAAAMQETCSSSLHAAGTDKTRIRAGSSTVDVSQIARHARTLATPLRQVRATAGSSRPCRAAMSPPCWWRFEWLHQAVCVSECPKAAAQLPLMCASADCTAAPDLTPELATCLMGVRIVCCSSWDGTG
jgi:hypothetical protein